MTTICNWNLSHLFPKLLKIRGFDKKISHGICLGCRDKMMFRVGNSLVNRSQLETERAQHNAQRI